MKRSVYIENIYRIETINPLEQGLKLFRFHRVYLEGSIETINPLEQGLKHTSFVVTINFLPY